MPVDPAFDPENRELYTSLMRSPDGYRFDHAVDVVYICSNQAIAEQNIKSLNVIGSATKPLHARAA